jgi:hypothetical protein
MAQCTIYREWDLAEARLESRPKVHSGQLKLLRSFTIVADNWTKNQKHIPRDEARD